MDPDIIFFIMAIGFFFLAYVISTIILIRKTLRLEDKASRFTIISGLILLLPILPYFFFNMNEESWFIGNAAIGLASLIIGICLSFWAVNKFRPSGRNRQMLIIVLSIPLGALPILLVFGISKLFDMLDLLGPCC